MQTTVHVALYDQLADWELGFATTAINDPQWQTRPGRFEIVTVAETTEPITTMGGLRVTPDLTLDQLEPARSAMLVLAGSHGWDQRTIDPAPWAMMADRFLDAGNPVAAICGATFGLAGAGLLDHRSHTSSAPDYLAMADGYDGADHYQEAEAVNDDGLITAGPTAPIAFAREIVAELGAFAPDVLDAWFGHYSTSEATYFRQLREAIRV